MMLIPTKSEFHRPVVNLYVSLERDFSVSVNCCGYNIAEVGTRAIAACCRSNYLAKNTDFRICVIHQDDYYDPYRYFLEERDLQDKTPCLLVDNTFYVGLESIVNLLEIYDKGLVRLTKLEVF